MNCISALIDMVVKKLKVHEGFRSQPYKDTEDNWSIGFGTLMLDMEIDELLGPWSWPT